MTREELQSNGAKFLEKRRRLICQWSTGVGKSGVVLNFIKAHPGISVLIFVPEQNNIQNWVFEFEKFGVSIENVTISCYASIHKYENTKWDLLVFDEAPHVDTEKRAAICKTIYAEYVLALGAVVTDDERQTLESLYGNFLVWRINLHQAIEWGLLPAPTVNILHMQIDDKERLYLRDGRKLTAKQYYDVIQNEVKKAVDAFNAQSTEFNRVKMLRAGSERKRFLGKLKEDAALKICQRLNRENKRFLCFCSSIEQAEKLGKDRAFTSKTSAALDLLEKFNNEEINSLYVVGKLIEGQNLKNIHCGVIVQLGGTNRITVQECGRIMRSSDPVIYAPVFDGTKDDSFLTTLTYNVPEECVKHYNF